MCVIEWKDIKWIILQIFFFVRVCVFASFVCTDVIKTREMDEKGSPCVCLRGTKVIEQEIWISDLFPCVRSWWGGINLLHLHWKWIPRKTNFHQSCAFFSLMSRLKRVFLLEQLKSICPPKALKFPNVNNHRLIHETYTHSVTGIQHPSGILSVHFKHFLLLSACLPSLIISDETYSNNVAQHMEISSNFTSFHLLPYTLVWDVL